MNSKNMRLFAALILFVFGAMPIASLPKIEEATLKNGIPVYLAHTDSRLLCVRIVVKGGAAYLDEDTSGLEKSAFAWMTYGSKKYSKKAIDQLSYDYLFSVSSSASQDDASLYVTCIDKYAKKALDVLCDMFINPAFSDDELPLVIDGIKSSLAMKKEDPESLLSDTVSRAVYANHPYRVKSFVTEKSFHSITKENMITIFQRDMDKRRIFVAASGNVTIKSLAAILNRTIGKIGALDTPLIEREIPPISLDGKNIAVTSKSLDGTGYMQWVAPGPSAADADAPAAMVASLMYSRQLFNVVREARGACYSAQSLCSVGKLGMVGVYLHSVSDLQHAAAYEREARELLKEGKIASSSKDNSKNHPEGVRQSSEKQNSGAEKKDLIYEDATDSIEGIKNAFLNSYYEGSVSSSSVCSRMAYSISLLGDPVGYDALIERISTVTASEALDAFKKYWTHGQWFAVTGPNDKDKIIY